MIDGTLDIIFTNLASILQTGLQAYDSRALVSPEMPTSVPSLPYGWLQPSMQGGTFSMDTLQGGTIGAKVAGTFVETHNIEFVWFVGNRNDPNLPAVEREWRKWHRRVLLILMAHLTLNGTVYDTTLHSYRPAMLTVQDGTYVGASYRIEITTRPAVSLLP